MDALSFRFFCAFSPLSQGDQVLHERLNASRGITFAFSEQGIGRLITRQFWAPESIFFHYYFLEVTKHPNERGCLPQR